MKEIEGGESCLEELTLVITLPKTTAVFLGALGCLFGTSKNYGTDKVLI